MIDEIDRITKETQRCTDSTVDIIHIVKTHAEVNAMKNALERKTGRIIATKADEKQLKGGVT